MNYLYITDKSSSTRPRRILMVSVCHLVATASSCRLWWDNQVFDLEVERPSYKYSPVNFNHSLRGDFLHLSQAFVWKVLCLKVWLIGNKVTYFHASNCLQISNKRSSFIKSGHKYFSILWIYLWVWESYSFRIKLWPSLLVW